MQTPQNLPIERLNLDASKEEVSALDPQIRQAFQAIGEIALHPYIVTLRGA